MKKIKSTLCLALLSTTLVANVFASGTISTSTFGVFGSVINAVALMLRSDSCPVRQCQDCRPGEEVDENGNCRPKGD